MTLLTGPGESVGGEVDTVQSTSAAVEPVARQAHLVCDNAPANDVVEDTSAFPLMSASRYFISRIVLFAMLFSAISPALAALRFSGNAEVLANIIGEHPAAHRATQPEHSTQHDQTGHANSGTQQVYCSFCLDMTSAQILAPAAPRLLAPLFLTEGRHRIVEQTARLLLSYSPQNPRAPPSPLV